MENSLQAEGCQISKYDNISTYAKIVPVSALPRNRLLEGY